MPKREAAVSADALEDDYLVEDLVEEEESPEIEGDEIVGNAGPDQGSASLKRKTAEDIGEEPTKKKKKKKPKKVRLDIS